MLPVTQPVAQLTKPRPSKHHRVNIFSNHSNQHFFLHQSLSWHITAFPASGFAAHLGTAPFPPQPQGVARHIRKMLEYSAVSPNPGISLSPCPLGPSISPPQRERGYLNFPHVHQGRHKGKQGARCSLERGDATG